MRIGYAQKSKLACALGLNAQYLPTLLNLGKIRNDFAHKLDTGLSAHTVSVLFKTFPKSEQDMIAITYFSLLSSDSKAAKLNFESLDPKDQFVLMALCINAMLIVAVHNVSHRED